MAEAATTPAPAGTTEAAPVVPAAPERPAWLPEKFKTPEDMAKSYTELEKKLGAPKPKDALQIPTDPPVPELGDDAGVDALLARAKVTEADVVAAWREKGELTPEQYAAFKKQGVTKAMANDYMATKSQLGTMMESQMMKTAHDKAGGEEQFKNLLSWAKTALSDSDKEWYDAQVGSIKTYDKGIEWLLDKHKEAIGAGKAQPLINGGSGAQPVGGFTSQAEMLTAMNDKRYKNDRSYKAAVDARIAKMDSRTIHGR